jgi:hypothetical protein
MIVDHMLTSFPKARRRRGRVPRITRIKLLRRLTDKIHSYGLWDASLTLAGATKQSEFECECGSEIDYSTHHYLVEGNGACLVLKGCLRQTGYWLLLWV